MDEAQIRIAFIEWMRAALQPAAPTDVESREAKQVRLIAGALSYEHLR